jgi:hypothetical protein
MPVRQLRAIGLLLRPIAPAISDHPLIWKMPSILRRVRDTVLLCPSHRSNLEGSKSAALLTASAKDLCLSATGLKRAMIRQRVHASVALRHLAQRIARAVPGVACAPRRKRRPRRKFPACGTSELQRQARGAGLSNGATRSVLASAILIDVADRANPLLACWEPMPRKHDRMSTHAAAMRCTRIDRRSHGQPRSGSMGVCLNGNEPR